MQRKIFSVLIIFSMVFSFSKIFIIASAETSGYFTYSVSNGEATITSCDKNATGEIVIPDTLGGYPVTRIGDYAFQGCYSITNVDFPDTLSYIGSQSFYGCGIKHLYLKGNNLSIGSHAFAQCKGIESVILSDGVVSLSDSVFYYCDKMKSLSIGKDLSSVMHSCFKYCEGLTEIYYDATKINSYFYDMFYNAGQETTGITVYFGNDVQIIPKYLFDVSDNPYRPKIRNVVLGTNVTEIGLSAFYGLEYFNVYYSGGPNDKVNIKIDSYNSSLEKSNWVYNCDENQARFEIRCSKLKSWYLKTSFQIKSGTTVDDESFNLILTSTIDDLEDYKNIGFYITISGYNNGIYDEPIKYSTDKVYTFFENGTKKVYAGDYGGKYFCVANMEISKEYYSSIIKVVPYIIFNDGTEICGYEKTTSVKTNIK